MKDPVETLTEIQRIILRYRKLANSGTRDATHTRMLLLLADAVEERARELDRSNDLT